MGNCFSKGRIKDGEEVHSRMVAGKPQSSAAIYEPEGLLPSRKQPGSGMRQIGSNNTANIGTYNDVAGNQINYNMNDPEAAFKIQEQGKYTVLHGFGGFY